MNPQKVFLVAACDSGSYLAFAPPQLRDTQGKPPGAADLMGLTPPARATLLSFLP